MCLPLLAAPAVASAALASSVPAAGAAAAAAAATTGFAAATTTGISLSSVALGASLLSGAVGAYGAYQQGQSGKVMNDYQTKMLQQQSVLAQRNADENMQLNTIQAAADSKQLAIKNARLVGAQEATAAANGTASGATAADIKVDTFDNATLDQQAIQYNASLKNWEILNKLGGEQWSLNAQENQYSLAAKNSAKSGTINAFGSIIGSAAQVANNRLIANYYSRPSVSGY